MTFADSHMLYLIWLVPAVAALFAWGGMRRRRILSSFASEKSRASVLPERTTGRRRIKATLMVLTTLSLILALAGPRYGYVWQEVERKGVDIVVALDCSKSMLAEDVKPSRLERAKREIIDLLAMLEGDRVGLVAFAGEAFLQCPLTLDYSSFNMFLDALTPSYLPVGGTDLAGALAVSMEAFKAEDATDKAVILITDGESTDGTPEEVAKKAAELGIKVFTIGVGSREGVPVPDAGGGFKKNRDGSILLSKLDAATLKRMAAITGGSFVRSVAGDMDLDVIYTQGIRKTMEARSLESSRKKVWENRYQWFLAAAVAFLLAYLGLGDARKNGTVALVALCLFLPRYASALDLASPLEKGVTAFDVGDYEGALTHFIDGQLNDPDNPAIDFNIGTAYYRLEKFDEAANSFERAARSEDPSLKNKALYNLGNSRFKKGEVKEAIETWENLLKANPEDKRTAENLDFARKRLEEMKQQPKNQQGKGDNQPQKDGEQESQDSQNSGQQGQQDQGQKDQGQKDQGQQGGQDQQPPPDPEKSGGEKAGQQQQASSPDPADANPAGGQPGDEAPGTEENQAMGSQGEPGDEEMQQAASALNRLKDKPGGVMMRRAEKRRVEKDW